MKQKKYMVALAGFSLLSGVASTPSLADHDYGRGYRDARTQPTQVRVFIVNRDNPQIAKRLRVMLRNQFDNSEVLYVNDRSRADLVYRLNVSFSDPILRDHRAREKSKKVKIRPSDFHRGKRIKVRQFYTAHKEKWAMRYKASYKVMQNRRPIMSDHLRGRIRDNYHYIDDVKTLTPAGWRYDAPLKASLQPLADNVMPHKREQFYRSLRRKAMRDIAINIHASAQSIALSWGASYEQPHNERGRGANRPIARWQPTDTLKGSLTPERVRN